MPENFGEFIVRLTDNARTSLQHAESIARGQGSPYIGTEHLLLGVMAQGSSVGAKLLADAGITIERAELALNLSPQSLVITNSSKVLSETAMLTLKMAYEHATELNQEFLGTEHILYSILRQKSARGTVLLRDLHVDVEELVDELESFFDRQSQDSRGAETIAGLSRKRRGNSMLDVHGTDLTERAREGKIDAVVGRDQETRRIITILSRRTKNNPVLIGEPGVGKTAIVEGLARRIVEEDVPTQLLDARIVQLDMASMVAGTKYRGEFEERLKKIIEEIRSDKDIIVFIDELHLLVGAGSAEGAMDAANILKPALARGEIRLIGATTIDEYRKSIENDAALDRRFQSIMVREPSQRDTIAIVKGLREYYEAHHGVTLSDEILELSVQLADRYVTDRFRPDKAIDVIDEAAALARVNAKAPPSKLRTLAREVRSLNDKMEEAVMNQDYERAALYKTHISRLEAQKTQLETEYHEQTALPLDHSHVAQAISAMTGVPVEKVQASELRLLKNLEKRLAKHLVGQEEAVEAVARAIRRSRSGISSANRPIGSFVFMGPTGVGKTELARVLAREVFGRNDALIKIDMSEFSERHTTSRLIGAPAGYIGYENGGKLTDKIRRQPYSVVLFDEIEKAHPDVFHLLLQLLEDGELTDASGRNVDFSNAIIILTSNLGSDQMMRESKLGFSVATKSQHDALDAAHKENAQAARRELESFMRPELINRFDAIVTFKALTRREIRKILDLLLEDVSRRLLVQGVGLSVSSRAKRWIIDRGFDDKHGARPLRRVIENTLEHIIAEQLLEGKIERGDTVSADVKDRQLVIEVTNEAALATT